MSHLVWLPYSQFLDLEKIQVFCFPHSGSGASCYRDWVKETESKVQFIPVELPGRESRFTERPYQKMEDLIDDFCRELKNFIKPNSAFFGHSLGGYIAFEIAKKFREQSAHLIVSGSSAPANKRSKKIAHLPDRELLSEVRSYGGIPHELLAHTDLIELLLPALRADLQLFENYQPNLESTINGRIAVIGGTQDHIAPLESLTMWKKHTSTAIDCHQIPGDHFFHKNSPQAVKTIVETFATNSQPTARSFQM